LQEARDKENTTRSGTDAAHTDAELNEFVRKMAENSAAEIELGRMASQRGVDQEVKQFGSDMANDHARAADGLKQIAAQLGISVAPPQLDAEHRALADRLSKLNGTAFDRAYAEAMVDGHQKVLTLLEQHGGGRINMTGGGGRTEGTHPVATGGAAEKGQQVIAEWAAKTVPIVEAHLQRARLLQVRFAGDSASPPKK
jgi:predicted outer membrane protein